MNISSASGVKNSSLQTQSPILPSGNSSFGETLAQVNRLAELANSTSSSSKRVASQTYTAPSLWLNGLEDRAPVNLLVDPGEYKARQQAGRADKAKPNVAEFMAKAGLDAKEASKLLYGSLGAIPDMRDWSAIMASGDPAIAARHATSALINSASHATSIGDSLNSAGYKVPRQSDIVAQSGNLTVIRERTDSQPNAYSLRITDASGHIVQSVPWSADLIATKMRDYGIDTATLNDLAAQFNAEGLSYALPKLA